MASRDNTYHSILFFHQLIQTIQINTNQRFRNFSIKFFFNLNIIIQQILEITHFKVIDSNLRRVIDIKLKSEFVEEGF